METFEYDERGRLSRVTDPNGAVALYTYDDAAKTVVKMDAAGDIITTTYNAQGQAQTITDQLGRTQSFTYKPGTNHIAFDHRPCRQRHEVRVRLQGSAHRHRERPLREGGFVFSASGEALETTDGMGPRIRRSRTLRGGPSSSSSRTARSPRRCSTRPPTPRLSRTRWARLRPTGSREGPSHLLPGLQRSVALARVQRRHQTRTYALPSGQSAVEKYDCSARGPQLAFSDGTTFQYKWDEKGDIQEVHSPTASCRNGCARRAGEDAGFEIHGLADRAQDLRRARPARAGDGPRRLQGL